MMNGAAVEPTPMNRQSSNLQYQIVEGMTSLDCFQPLYPNSTPCQRRLILLSLILGFFLLIAIVSVISHKYYKKNILTDETSEITTNTYLNAEDSGVSKDYKSSEVENNTDEGSEYSLPTSPSINTDSTPKTSPKMKKNRNMKTISPTSVTSQDELEKSAEEELETTETMKPKTKRRKHTTTVINGFEGTSSTASYNVNSFPDNSDKENKQNSKRYARTREMMKNLIWKEKQRYPNVVILD